MSNGAQLSRNDYIGGLYNYRDPGLSYAFQSLGILLRFAQMGAFVIALIGFYSSRNRLRWMDR